jgi:RHS repeat-associated protein
MTNPVLNFEDSNLTADITKRGFTDHEHLDNFELIHMNGRMYDFNNGRFLSVDPFIQGTTSQAINPYSYIQNNPLSGTDPTGYLSECTDDGECKIENVEKVELDKNGKTIVTTSDGQKFEVADAKITATANGKKVEISVGISTPGGISTDISNIENQNSVTLNVQMFGRESQSFSSFFVDEVMSGAAKDRIHGTASAAVGIFDPTEDFVAVKDCVVGDGSCLAAAMMILTRKIDKLGEVVQTAGKALKKPTKTDMHKEHLTRKDLEAARLESQGVVVARKSDGTPWDHIDEVQNSQRGLLNRIEKINRQLSNPNLSATQRKALQDEMSTASKLLDKSEGYLPRN